MNEHLESALLFALITGAGVLAIKLPYRYNPFRLTSVIARGLSETAQRRVPKIIGWMLIAVGGLGFLLMLLMFVGFGLKWISAKQEEAGEERQKQEFRMSEAALAQKVVRFVQEADDFEWLVVDPKTGKAGKVVVEDRAAALVRLKEALGSDAMRPRLDPSSALFFLTPKVIAFKHKNEVTGQIGFAGDISAFCGVLPSGEIIYQSRVSPDLKQRLMVALPELKSGGERAAASNNLAR